MPTRIEKMLCRLDRLIPRLWAACLFSAQTPGLAQTSCDTYNQCAALQTQSSTKLNGPLVGSVAKIILESGRSQVTLP
jgi:hypothetical protein